MAGYKLGNLIGAGGFGKVFEGERIEDGWCCAIKELGSSANEDCRKRFNREVRMQSKLRHKNIVQIIEFNLEDDPPWFVMPRALFSLRDYLKKQKGENQIWIIYQIAAGIGYAHDNGVIHRDLKPENVLFFKDKNDNIYVSVSDFGIGRFITRDSPSLTQNHIPMGTIEYMAPEQYLNAKNVDHRADIYSLGKIICEILTGEIPYPEIDYSKVPRKFVYIIQKSCKKNIEDRYCSINEIKNDLNIVTKEENWLTKPAELIQDEVMAILEERDFTYSRIEKLAKLIIENMDDKDVLTVIFPKLPEPILNNLISHNISILMPVLKAYDKAVSYSLPFEYCDIVANFYEKIFKWTDSVAIKIMILRRLPKLGYSHNRWYVGMVFARIVDKIKDPSLILAVRDVLLSNKLISDWCYDYLKQYSLPSEIRNVFK